MRHSGLLTALVVGGTTLALPVAAHAENFSFHLEPGLVAPLSAPQNNLFGSGVVLDAKGLFALNHNLSIGPSLSAMYLPRVVNDNENAGVLWQAGGSIRLQGNRNNPNVPWSPWLDVDFMAAHTGALWRPAFDIGVGEEMAMDANHHFWVGPFARYSTVLETSDWQSGIALDRRDPHLLQAGISFSWDYPVPVREHTSTVVKYDRAVTESLPCVGSNSCPFAPVAVQDEGFVLNEKIYFDHDSSVLRWESKDRLDVVVKRLNDHPDSKIIVEGHASSDGEVKYNYALSVRRAAAVRQYLTDHGIESSRLTGVAFGVGSPVAPNTTQEGRERNRRVEFDVTFTSQDAK